MTYLNIITDSGDSVAEEVRNWLINDDPPVTGALGATGIGGRVDGYLRSGGSSTDLEFDLIAHSQNSVLQLGTWATDDGATTATLIQELEALGVVVSKIRLLGCSTAEYEGWACMRALHVRFVGSRLSASRAPIAIEGTTVPIGAGDFSHFRFSRTSFLKTFDPMLPDPVAPATVPDLTRQQWFRRFPALGGSLTPALNQASLRAETLGSAIADYRALGGRWPLHLTSPATLLTWIRSCSTSAALAPGLLAMPEREIFAPFSGPGARRFVRATILLRGAFVRVYPKLLPRGIVLRVPEAADPGLRALVAGSTPLPLPA